ncbi:hypothetical protein [Bacillus sp. V2I10]|uniref:hypothetical protein n=1 Tax=Bacillus sp. V2I10 TaxID=3042276 RepID=UPI00277F259D|nr:hypothetical protein [Bacillus sp. V2I10]MDQ0860572.1 hypothetical protein [Bacillus sp. V2I10]
MFSIIMKSRASEKGYSEILCRKILFPAYVHFQHEPNKSYLTEFQGTKEQAPWSDRQADKNPTEKSGFAFMADSF